MISFSTGLARREATGAPRPGRMAAAESAPGIAVPARWGGAAASREGASMTGTMTIQRIEDGLLVPRRVCR
jgi:hypothetical protein